MKRLILLCIKEFATQRLINVRDIFLFSCFTGLAYVDVANLTDENIITMDGKQWIVTARKKTDTLSHILLLDIPKNDYREICRLC